jgi:hypothetical protein
MQMSGAHLPPGKAPGRMPARRRSTPKVSPDAVTLYAIVYHSEPQSPLSVESFVRREASEALVPRPAAVAWARTSPWQEKPLAKRA